MSSIFPADLARLSRRSAFAALLLPLWLAGQPRYDLLLQGGHVIDAKNGISAPRDIAIKDGLIAAVAPRLNAADALKTVNVAGLYVTPGLIDIHVHVFTGTGERASYAGDNSLYPDGFTFRVGVTHGRRRGLLPGGAISRTSGAHHRPLQDARSRLPHIVGAGMRGSRFETTRPTLSPRPPPRWRRSTPK